MLAVNSTSAQAQFHEPAKAKQAFPGAAQLHVRLTDMIMLHKRTRRRRRYADIVISSECGSHWAQLSFHSQHVRVFKAAPTCCMTY